MQNIVAICIGSSFGALLRWQLSIYFNNILPFGTLIANSLGSYIIGFSIIILDNISDLNPAWRLLIITGFLGSLTTFSTFSSEVVNFLQNENYYLAFIWIISNVGISIILVILGIITAKIFL